MSRSAGSPSRVRRAAAIIGLIALIAGFAALTAWPAINDVETGATDAYPDVQPRAYRMSQARVFAAAVESFDALPRFEVVETDDQSVVRGTATTRLFRFVDDVTVRVEANGDAGAIVFIRSASRVGRGDFGQNARNIRALQDAMDSNLGVEP